jgi:murein DD-endopeptidase
MSEMPTLGRSSYRSGHRVWRALMLIVVVLAGAGLATWRWLLPPRASAPAPVAAPPLLPVPSPPSGAPAPAAAEVPRKDGIRSAHLIVLGPLETAYVTALGRELGTQLNQVVTRTLVWWVTIPGDLRRGDAIDVLFNERSDAEPLVHAVRFRSEKAGRTFEAYRFQAEKSQFARFYTRDGKEVELRLRDAPLDDHEQVTSLLRDGRGHKGVDFRTPIGTPVRATFDAVLARRNWTTGSNGNCLELRGANRSALFLHLAETAPDLRVGERIGKGQIIAKSGNTGHSFAPHLHYQLVSPSGAVLDPFATEPTLRRELPTGDRARFDDEVKRLDAILATPATTTAGH